MKSIPRLIFNINWLAIAVAFFCTDSIAQISLSNSTWTFYSGGISETQTLVPSQGDAWDTTNQVSIDGTTITGTLNTDDTNDIATWTNLLQPNANLSIGNYMATGVEGFQAFQVTFDISNISETSQSFSLHYQWNLGADSSAQIIDTSDGDSVFETTDTWILTDDYDTAGGDPATYVNFGAQTPSSVYRNADTFRLAFDEVFSVGESRSYSFVLGVEPSSTAAQESVINVPEPASFGLLTGILTLAVLCWFRNPRRRSN